MTQDSSLFLKMRPTLAFSEIPIANIRCQGCGEPVFMLPQNEADKLRQLEAPDGLQVLGVVAFECRTCAIVLFEDELIGGRRFVPPDFLPLPTQPTLQEISLTE